MDFEMNGIAGPSRPAARKDTIYIADPPFDSTPQPSFDYHSLDNATDPAICIDNGRSHTLSGRYADSQRAHTVRLIFLASWIFDNV